MRHLSVPALALLGIASLPLLIPSEGRRGTFYWRREEGPSDAEGSVGPRAVGSAWVIEADGTKRVISGGDWITRAEAERLASAGEYTLAIEGESETA